MKGQGGAYSSSVSKESYRRLALHTHKRQSLHFRTLRDGEEFYRQNTIMSSKPRIAGGTQLRQGRRRPITNRNVIASKHAGPSQAH